MNYMTMSDPPPAPPECPTARRQYLNFDAKRVGRALADLHLESTRHIIMVMPLPTIDMACGVTFVGAPLQRLFANWDWDWDAQALGMFGGVEAVVSTPPAEDDASEDLVQWFAEQQATAEQAVATGGTREDDLDEGEVILARQGGLRSNSWRGGGTMRRR